MGTARKMAMATASNTTGNGYHCPLSSAAVAAAVGYDDKGGDSLFLYGVVIKKIGLCVFSILIFGKEALLFPPYSESRGFILTVLSAHKKSFWCYHATPFSFSQ